MNFNNRISLALCLAFAAWCAQAVNSDKVYGSNVPDAYERLAGKLSEGHKHLANKKVAVLPFSYVDKRASDDGVVVSERLLTPIINMRKLEVIERGLLERVLAELKLQRSGGIDESSIKGLGKVLGVEAVVTGSLTRQKDGRLSINARLIKTDTALILAAAAETVQPDWETAPAPVPAPAPAPTPAPKPAAGATFALLMQVPDSCPRGIVSYWGMDGDGGTELHDAKGGNHVTLPDKYRWTEGRIGSALRLNGPDDKVNLGNSPSLNISGDQITLGAWVRMEGYAPSFGRIINKHCCGSDRPPYATYNLAWDYADNGKGYLALAIGNVRHELRTIDGLPPGLWTHLVGTYDGSMMKLYVNGYLNNQVAANGNLGTSPRNTYIGGGEHVAENFRGRIDEVFISSRALSAEEIARIYQDANAGGRTCRQKART